MSDRLEIAITKDSKNKDVNLDAMSLEATNAFITLVESIKNILELTPDKGDVTIRLEKGSAAVIAEGPKIKAVEQSFLEVVENRSTRRELVEQWRKIQTLFNNNGLHYRASLVTGKNTTPVFDMLKSARTLRVKSSVKQNSTASLLFLTGKLVAAGGKYPNIHVELGNNEKITINCSHESAKKATRFLYDEIIFSAYKTGKGDNAVWDLCDSYYKEQLNVVKDFEEFFDKYKSEKDEIKALKLLHYECRRYLDNQDYGIFRKFMRLFNHPSVDINDLKTILIITQSFIDHKDLKEPRQSLRELYEAKLNTKKRKLGKAKIKSKE